MHYSLVVLCIEIGLRIIKTNGSLKKQLFCVWNINLRQFGSLKTDLIHKLVPAFFFFFLFRDQTFQPFKTRKYNSHIKFQRNQSILCLLFLNTQQRNLFIFYSFCSVYGYICAFDLFSDRHRSTCQGSHLLKSRSNNTCFKARPQTLFMASLAWYICSQRARWS